MEKPVAVFHQYVLPCNATLCICITSVQSDCLTGAWNFGQSNLRCYMQPELHVSPCGYTTLGFTMAAINHAKVQFYYNFFFLQISHKL